MAAISRELGIGYGSVYRILNDAGKTPAPYK